MDATLLFLSAASVAGLSVPFLLHAFRKANPQLPSVFMWLLFVLPFAVGGFYTWLAVPVSGFLLGVLWLQAKQSGSLKLYLNLPFAAVAAVFAGFCLTPLWAADKGMAVFGFVRFLPILLYALLLMQLPQTQRETALLPIPFCGVIMTVLSLGLQFLPAFTDALTVNGRLAGFFQYPNTFAVFLLAGLVIQGTKNSRRIADTVTDSVLILGIIISGSRTAFILLLACVVFLIAVRRKAAYALGLLGCVGIGILLAELLAGTMQMDNADRYSTISVTSGTFLARLLYFKDALGVILQHPFGIGYWGYQAMEGSFQTGRYFVTYVHNGLLQLLLDIGWVPAILLATAFAKAMFSKKTSIRSRGILGVVLAHCMLDFDLQYLVIWFILLSALDFSSGKYFALQKSTGLWAAAAAAVLAICVWLGIGDYLYNKGNVEACLSVTPFHTDARIATLQGESDPDQLDRIGDQILSQNQYASIGYSAKANAAFSRGDITSMILYKEQAIQCARYSLNEYCDYIDKLRIAYELYLQVGDIQSAQYCLEKLGSVEEMIHAVTIQTSPLAYLTGDDSSLILPDNYRQYINAIRSN